LWKLQAAVDSFKECQQSNNYIIVEHIYHVEQVKPQIKIEPFEVRIEDSTKVPLPITPPTCLPPGRYNCRPGLKDQGKMVSFNPVVHKQEFHSPPSPIIHRTKEKDGFLKEVIKSAAETLFPPIKAEYSPDIRPI
jgi:hypothetical protein